jgi:hypothetical protein
MAISRRLPFRFQFCHIFRIQSGYNHGELVGIHWSMTPVRRTAPCMRLRRAEWRAVRYDGAVDRELVV